MNVYCLWEGDIHENQRILLAHEKYYPEIEFENICNTIRNKLINYTSKNHEIMDTFNGVKSIWEYSISMALMLDIKKVLINDYGFVELKDFPKYHVEGVDPYDYPED